MGIRYRDRHSEWARLAHCATETHRHRSRITKSMYAQQRKHAWGWDSKLKYLFHLWYWGWNPHFKSTLAPSHSLTITKSHKQVLQKPWIRKRIPTELRWHLQVTPQRRAVRPCELVPIFCHQFLQKKRGNRIAHYNNVGPSARAWNARVSQRSCRDYRDTCSFPNLAIVYHVSTTKSLVGNLVLKKYLFSASKEPLDSESQSKLLSHRGQQADRLTKVILSFPNLARAIE